MAWRPAGSNYMPCSPSSRSQNTYLIASGGSTRARTGAQRSFLSSVRSKQGAHTPLRDAVQMMSTGEIPFQIDDAVRRIRREWVEVEHAASGRTVRVMQWNLLADGLAQTGRFVYANKEDLEWKRRLRLMVDEIEQAQPDIITFQECNHFSDSWEPTLGALGYRGIHVMKQSSPATFYGAPSDGLAMFWRDDRLECKDSLTFHYRHQAEAVNGASLGILVATTHLKAKNSEENDKIRHGQALGEEFQNAAFLVLRAPPLGDDPWRAIQERLPVCSRASLDPAWPCFVGEESPSACAELLEAVTDYCHTLAGRTGVKADKVPIVITGDFNTEPSSNAISKMDHSLLRLESYWSLFGDREGTRLDGLFSTWKIREDEGEKKRIIDYVWWRGGCMTPVRCWKPPSAEELGPYGLPCAVYPSDHVSLLLELHL